MNELGISFLYRNIKLAFEHFIDKLKNFNFYSIYYYRCFEFFVLIIEKYRKIEIKSNSTNN